MQTAAASERTKLFFFAAVRFVSRRTVLPAVFFLVPEERFAVFVFFFVPDLVAIFLLQ